ncbi:MAG TPA: prolyl oligopeptidase family serine peptidase, partial [Flavobacterium sp.]|nr:prolyl oligopeptidase family serine peptidase [Flavobacterium sp.]
SGKEEVFLDPNGFAKDGTSSLSALAFSKDGSLVAYAVSEAGSDWVKVYFMDAVTKKVRDEQLVDVKFSGLSWKGNEGIFYSRYDRPKGSVLSAKTDQHKLYFHALGTPQKKDVLIFGGEEKRRYVGGSVSEDGRYLIISTANSTSGNELYIKDLSNTSSKIIAVNTGFDYDIDFLDHENGVFYFVTNHKAPNKRVVAAKIGALDPSDWRDIIQETDNVLTASACGGYFFAHYMRDAVSFVQQVRYDGTVVNEIKLPGLGTANGFRGKKTDRETYFSFTNYTTPSSIYSIDIATGERSAYWKPTIAFNPDDYTSEQIFYLSKDGTRVPMIITYKKGLTRNGKNPTLLYGYGGFDVSLTPSFSVYAATWMELGGIYAVPNLRGGGEYGRRWHDMGTKMQKQNVFDDFIGAAQYLIKERYTSSDFLAIEGGSNGGLLVGATMTQRPELFRVALPAVGVLDMLRYHRFTAGAGWAYDYGTADDSKEMFEYLRNYSPVHNVRKDTRYPATMVTTSDHDDRVVPAHSFKFAAELQAKQSGADPVLIRIETNAGHGAGKSVSKAIAEDADAISFTLFNMGFSKLP